MQTEAVLHRSCRNLRAYRAASHLRTDLFWLSRRFPSSLYRSLTRPLRHSAGRATTEIMNIWRNRHSFQEADVAVEQALGQLSILSQYLLRGYEEDVLDPNELERFQERVALVRTQVRRLGRSMPLMN